MADNSHIAYLEKIDFKKRLEYLAKKLKNKSIVIYGAGSFFQVINENYDLSCLNIIALADKKFSIHEEDETYMGYRVCSPHEIKTLNPDYVLVGTLMVVNTIEEIEDTILRGTKIKVKPLIKKPFKDLWAEVWG